MYILHLVFFLPIWVFIKPNEDCGCLLFLLICVRRKTNSLGLEVKKVEGMQWASTWAAVVFEVVGGNEEAPRRKSFHSVS